MNLEQFFRENPRVALGFSGGVDSSYLLYAANKWGSKVGAYFIKTAFQPEFERRDALALAEQLGVRVQILETDILCSQIIAKNPKNRCYHCKTALFTLLKKQAMADGFSVLIDGTNASDDIADRPGMRALRELSVRSPLQECGLTKAEIRRRSQEAGLFTWNKPAYACLATRIPTDTAITSELLHRIECGEDALFAMGFSDFRLRVYEGAARIQLPETQFVQAIAQKSGILAALSPYFTLVFLDLKAR
ncbi:MAG: ATP-dependent sacrificial sulfur transferase LarE [Oscillospiraceae bacterium]